MAIGLGSAQAQNAVGTLTGAVGSPGFNNATGTSTLFHFASSPPSGVAVDSSGNLFVADTSNNVIRKVTISGGVATTSTFAGSASGTAGNGDGTGTAAFFNGPQGLAIDGANNLYVADAANHAIRRITSAGVVTTLGGTAGGTNASVTVASGYVNNASGAVARFNTPLGISCDRTGTSNAALNVFVADTQNNAIRQIVLNSSGVTTNVTTLAGSATGVSGNADTTSAVPNTTATFSHPNAIVSDSPGTTLYIADTFNYAIRKIVISGGGTTAAVTRLAGTGSAGSYTEGTGTGAQFNNPSGVALDGSGNILVADTFFQIIRSITTGGVSSLYAGAANSSGNGDGLATAARFNFPSGIAFDGVTNSVYVIDTNNQTIRKIAAAVSPSITAQPASTSKAAGTSATFTVAISATANPPATFQWQRNPGGTGSFANISLGDSNYSGSTTATLTIPSVTTGMNNDKFQVVVSNAQGNATSNGTATLTVLQAPAFSSANNTSVNVGQSNQQFTITTTGAPTPSLSQSGNFPSFSQFTDNGNGTATITSSPISASGPYTFTISATNTGGTTNQTFTLNVSSGPSITSQPSNQTVGQSSNAQFAVNATGATSYQWQRQPASGGGFQSLGDNGIYSGSTTSTLTVINTTLAMSGDLFQVVVTNNVGNTTSTPASLTILQAPQITSLNNATFVENVNSSFTVQATGSPAPTFSVTSGSLPSGLQLNASTGSINGTPTTGTSTSSPYNLQITASNFAGSANQTFTLTVTPTALVPAFTTQPSNITVALGQTATFTVVATGSPAPTYQWQRQLSGSSGFGNISDNGTFSGTASATLTITSPSSGMSGDQYVCVATNNSGSTSSSAASLTVVVGATITTFAGQAGSPGSADGVGLSARFNGPASIAVDNAGNFYVADSSNHVIRKITSSGVVTTLAGLAGSSGNVDGTGTAARFNAPSGVAVDSAGNVYVADTYNHTIRVIAPGGAVTTLAGLAGNLGSLDGLGTAARFNYPTGVAVDAASTVYVADSFNHAIRKIVNGSVSTFAGALGVRGNTDSPSRFAYPNSVAVDSSGNAYVADSFNQTIRKISPGGAVSTLAGTAGTIGSTDGTGSAALFNTPSGIAVDASGNVYVADTGSNTIRKVTSGGVVTTLAGLAGSSGSADGSGSIARFNAPFGLAVDSSGNLFIADTRNNTIRRSGTVSAPSIQTQPQNQTAGVGGNASFTVAATGAPTPTIFQWQRQANGTTGFVNLSNDSTYSGATSATLTVTNVTSAMSGDQFLVIVTNLISPNATSNTATLTTFPPPAFTSAASATFNVGQTNSFTVAATSSTTTTFSATGLPSSGWLSLNPSSGVLSGTPPDASGSPIQITLSANNGAIATQTFALTLVVPVVLPTITSQPAGISVNRGATATLSVAVIGTAPFTYQWSKGGAPITGATSSTLTIVNTEAANAGTYSVVITNSLGSVTSNTATLAVNATPIISVQPRAQAVIAGNSVTFTVTATGSPSPTYQWRLNGVPLAGANSSSYTISAAQVFNAGNYDVVVGNAFGQLVSSVAQLTVSSTATAPFITSQPASRTVLVGTSTTFTVTASGAPTPSYQWRKNGVAIGGATASLFILGVPQPGDGGTYDVVVSNSAGTVISSAASLTVVRRSYAGTYFGSFGGSLGSFAIYIRPDNTGVFLGFIPGSNIPVKNLSFIVSDTGQFNFIQSATGGISGSSVGDDGAPRAAAAGDVGFVGSIATDGSLSGTVSGVAGASLSATKSTDVGATQSTSGFYQAGATNSSSTLLSITSAAGQAFVLSQTSTASDGGVGVIDSTGHITIVTSKQIVALTINADTSTISGTTLAGSTSTTYSGASEAVIATQRLGNISTRANVGTGNNVAIAGFVISGTDSKPVLIRAIGPTMTAFGFANPLGAPKLDLYSGSTVIATNTVWGTASNAPAIVSASSQAGAFALSASSADSVIFTTLTPGNYTAIVSSANGGTGVALIEVYDLSAPTTGQKLFNISTRANAGTGLNTLVAGFVINGVSPKRLLIRGVGPGLVQLGVPGALGATQLQIINTANAVVAQNTGWGTSPDASAIAVAANQVGAFPLVAGSGDSALIVSLAPGNYSAQLNPVNSTGGIAIIEVYELP